MLFTILFSAFTMACGCCGGGECPIGCC